MSGITNNTFLSKKNEELVVAAFLKLVDHITQPPPAQSKEEQAWRDKYQDSNKGPKLTNTAEWQDKNRIRKLEHELAQANAKLSKRL